MVPWTTRPQMYQTLVPRRLQNALHPDTDALCAVADGRHPDGARLLGRFDRGRDAMVIAYLPAAVEARIEGRRRLKPLGESPIFVWTGPAAGLPTPYRIEWQDRAGRRHSIIDPYAFGAERALAACPRLGAEITQCDGVEGVAFRVLAPNARTVMLEAPQGSSPLYRDTPSGSWFLFVPGLGAGTPYAFEILTQAGERLRKTDPYGQRFEPRPGMRAQVVGPTRHRWTDDAWLDGRRQSAERPLSIYELHVGSFLDRPAERATYTRLATKIIEHVTPLGFTHVELLPVTEHPFEGSWGYQTTGYYAPTSRHGTPDELRAFVDRLHGAGLGVILDWVPGHFAADAHALALFDGTPLYEYADPRLGEHRRWGTRVFDFTSPRVREFLLGSARHFLREYHVDGLRVDAVAAMLYLDYDRAEGEWRPNDDGSREHHAAAAFLRELTTRVHEEFPGVMLIAEDSSLWPGVTEPVASGGLGFDFKWNLGWMHDSLGYFAEDPLFRRHHHGVLAKISEYSRTERGVLALSHDEVVHGKRSLLGRMPGDDWQRFANLRLLYAWQWTHPGAKLLFMGSELAPESEWNPAKALPFERRRLPAVEGLLRLLTDLNRLYREWPALHGTGRADDLTWLERNDDLRSIHVYVRRNGDSTAVVLINATPVPRETYVVGLPVGGVWLERLNTDSKHYGGSDVGNLGRIEATRDPAMGQSWSARVRLPPLGALILIPDPAAH